MMKAYLRPSSREIVIVSNENDAGLNVNNHIHNALGTLLFDEICIENCFYNNENKIKLIMYHGAFPEIGRKINYPIILLKMATYGLIEKPNFFRDPPSILKPRYHLQGGAGSTKKPSNIEEWTNLLAWLLNIEEKMWVKTESPPLPDDESIKEFVYTEPYPEELLSYYLVLLAKSKGIEIEIDDSIKNIAEEVFNKLSNKYFKCKMSISDINAMQSIFNAISKERAS